MEQKFIVKHRRGTYEQWVSSDITPFVGEICIELDEINNLHKLKIGDGIHSYQQLAYLKAGDEIVSQVLAQTLPHVVNVELDLNSWAEVTDITDINVGCYKQVVDIPNMGECCRLDLQPDVSTLAELREFGVTFVTENKGGVASVYSVGVMPTKTYTMQATLTETTVVSGSDCIYGIPIGAPTFEGVSGNFATTEYVDEKVASLVDSSPEVLDALNQLADALAQDPNMATSISEQLGNKVDKEDGKGLSSNDFTDAEKEKLANLDKIELSYLSIVDGQLCVTYEEV